MALWRRLAAAVARLALAALLAACGGTGKVVRPQTMDITVLGFNDLHGNLAPPGLTVNAAAPGEAPVWVPAGGAAYLTSLGKGATSRAAGWTWMRWPTTSVRRAPPGRWRCRRQSGLPGGEWPRSESAKQKTRDARLHAGFGGLLDFVRP